VITLPHSLAAWGSDAFNETFKSEVEQLPAEALPLQQGLALSSCVSSEPFKVMVISSAEDTGAIHIKAGVFYSGIIAGCSCSDDPTPTDVQAEYCDVAFVIDRASGETHISLLAD
jgi:hypothetical protein